MDGHLISKSSRLLSIFWVLFQVQQLQLVSPPPSFSIVFSFLSKSRYSFPFSLSFNFTRWSAGMSRTTIRQVLFFFCLLTITRSGRLAEIRWSVYISKSQRSFPVSFFRTDSRVCIYHEFFRPNFNFLHYFQWTNFPTHSCQVSYSFCVNLLHSLIIRFVVSSLSRQNLHLIFCCVLSIFGLVWFLYLMAHQPL